MIIPKKRLSSGMSPFYFQPQFGAKTCTFRFDEAWSGRLLTNFATDQRSVEDRRIRNYNDAVPAKDVIHDAVKNALVKDEGTITDDPLRLKYKAVNLSVDMAD